jgi:hypothetical protein
VGPVSFKFWAENNGEPQHIVSGFESQNCRQRANTPEVSSILAEMVCISKLFKSRETKGWQIHAILKVIGRKRQSLDDPAFVIYITPKDS